MSITQSPPPAITTRAVARIYTRQSGRVMRIRLVLLCMDLLVIVLLHLLAVVLVDTPRVSLHGSLKSSILSLITLPVFLFLNGAYGLASVQSAVRMCRALCLALPEYAVVVLLSHLFFPQLGVSPQGLILCIAGAGVGVSASRAVLFQALQHTKTRHNVLIIGAGWSGRTIGEILSSCPGVQFNIMGFVDDDPRKLGKAVLPDCPVIGTTAELARLASEYQVSELILAVTEQIPDRLFSILGKCAEQGVRTINMANLYEEISGRVPVKHIDDRWFLYCFSPERQWLYEVMKRIVDIGVSLAALLGVALLFPIIALAILLESGTPVLYRQVRVGRGGKLFTICKFRTMVQNAEANGAVWAVENDSRITGLGAWMRTTRLDELPQFWNVLRGEMSLVGPRPERPEFVQELSQTIPFYDRRHAVLPGITGWAQVKYPYGASVEDALQKLQYDLYYIKHRSLFLDFIIALKTIGTVITRRGR